MLMLLHNVNGSPSACPLDEEEHLVMLSALKLDSFLVVLCTRELRVSAASV